MIAYMLQDISAVLALANKFDDIETELHPQLMFERDF